MKNVLCHCVWKWWVSANPVTFNDNRVSISTSTMVDSWATVELLPLIKKLLPLEGLLSLALAVGCTGNAHFGINGSYIGCTGKAQFGISSRLHWAIIMVRVRLGNSYIVLYNSTSDVFKYVKLKELSSSTGWLVGMYSGLVIIESHAGSNPALLIVILLSMFFLKIF